MSALPAVTQPPPNPTISTEYLQKPRRQPAPTAYLFLLPSSTYSLLAPLKRRRVALSEIRFPNQKRQRALNVPGRKMSQSSRLLTKTSGRQAGASVKTKTTKTKALARHDLLATQRFVDPNATPRQTFRKRALPPSLPAPNLHTILAPITTPMYPRTKEMGTLRMTSLSLETQRRIKYCQKANSNLLVRE